MENQRREVARRLKAQREAAGLTAETVAARTDVTSETYARYESGRSIVPPGYLARLAPIYGLDPAVLLTGRDAHTHRYQVTRAGKGPVVERRHQYHYEGLGVGFIGRRMEPFLVRVEPGASEGRDLDGHPGQEFNWVVAGRLRIRVGEATFDLNAGDSIYFDATQPHGMSALDGRPAQFLALITP